MRDIFEDIFKNDPLDPMEAGAPQRAPDLAQALLQGSRRSRRTATASRCTLDGKPVRTPARRPLAAPTRELAQAIADEWQAQTEVIDPANMPLTRLANSIIDGVADNPGPVARGDRQISRLRSSVLSRRRTGKADRASGAGLGPGRGMGGAKRSARASSWSRAWCSPPSRRRRWRRPRRQSRPMIWRLGAVHSVTTLTGSALLALALAQGAITRETGLDARHMSTKTGRWSNGAATASRWNGARIARPRWRRPRKSWRW